MLPCGQTEWSPCAITVMFNCSTSEMKFRSIRNFLGGLTSAGLVSMLGFCGTTVFKLCS